MTAPVSAFDSKHQDMIHDAQMDYYGKRLATCSSDKTIKIFDVQPKGAPIHTADLIGHDGPVWQLSWAHPKWGSILASCSYDRKVIVWKEERPKQWQKLYEYTGHELSVNSISWAPPEVGLVLAIASSDGYVSVLTWKGDWAKVRFMAHSSGVNAVSWAPAALPSSLTVQRSGPDAGASSVPRLATGGCDNSVKIWQLHSGNEGWQLESTLNGHSDWVRDVAWAPSIGLPYSIIASCSQDQTVLIWTQTDANGNWNKSPLDYKFNSVVWRVSWSITGNILAVSSGDNKVTLWKESAGDKWQLISELDENEASGAPQQQQ